MSRTRLTVLALAATLANAAAGGHTVRGAQQPTASVSPPGAEFPPYDSGLRRMLQTGYTRKAAARLLAAGHNTPETVELLLKAGRVADALRVTRLIVEKHPEFIADTFERISREHDSIHRDRSKDYAATLHSLIDEARKRQPALPREEAARVERSVSRVDGRREDSGDVTLLRSKRLVAEYGDTEVGRLTQLDVMEREVDLPQRLDALDGFARMHPGTAAAAKALFMKGSALGGRMPADPKARKGEDPTGRFKQVLAVVTELRSGRYPACEWVELAPSLLSWFSAEDPVYSPENADWMRQALTDYAKTYFAPNVDDPLNTPVLYTLTRHFERLSSDKAAALAGVDRALLEVERAAKDPDAVRYLRAFYYIRTSQWERTVDRAGLRRTARELLADIAARRQDLYGRKALASLASLHFAERQYVLARDRFRQYLTAYPATEWTWVAALRMGQCEERMKNWPAAAAAYRAAGAYPAGSVGRVLGYEFTARADEALGHFGDALANHRAALAAWDDDFGGEYRQAYSLFETYYAENVPAPERDASRVSKHDLTDRVTVLAASLSVPSGDTVERARWLIENGGHRDALKLLQPLTAERSPSIVRDEGTYLAHRARLEIALDLPAVAAVPEFEALAAEPLDFAVLAARMARAYSLWKRSPAEGEAALTQTMDAWRAHQRPLLAAVSKDPVMRDVADIRTLLFRPSGDGVINLQSVARTSKSPFFIVDPAIMVRQPDGSIRRHVVYASFPDFPNVLYFTAHEVAFLRSMMAKLAGPPQRDFVRNTVAPVLWDKFFPMGGWDGQRDWTLATYPVISEIEFQDAARTMAAARVTAGDQGGTVVLEKIGGKWVAKALVNLWIS